MDRDFTFAIAALGIVAVIVGQKVLTSAGMNAIMNSVRSFLASMEGFSATSYWDVSRWSWGYGTQAPGPNETITRDAAADEMMRHVSVDYSTLKKIITQPLSVNQWTALLSFSYNLGPGNAQKLVPLINTGDYMALGAKWNEFVYADHKINQDLVERRQREWELFVS